MGRSFVERGGCWVLGQMLLLTLLLIAGLIWRGQWGSLVSTICGVGLAILAAIFGIAGVRALGRNLTPFPHPTGSARLVQHGIYRFVRHPLYTSVICMALGWALLWKSWPALGLAVLLAVFLSAKARVEERALLQQFPEYLDYKRRVKSFIPWIY